MDLLNLGLKLRDFLSQRSEQMADIGLVMLNKRSRFLFEDLRSEGFKLVRQPSPVLHQLVASPTLSNQLGLRFGRLGFGPVFLFEELPSFGLCAFGAFAFRSGCRFMRAGRVTYGHHFGPKPLVFAEQGLCVPLLFGDTPALTAPACPSSGRQGGEDRNK